MSAQKKAKLDPAFAQIRNKGANKLASEPAQSKKSPSKSPAGKASTKTKSQDEKRINAEFPVESVTLLFTGSHRSIRDEGTNIRLVFRDEAIILDGVPETGNRIKSSKLDSDLNSDDTTVRLFPDRKDLRVRVDDKALEGKALVEWSYGLKPARVSITLCMTQYHGMEVRKLCERDWPKLWDRTEISDSILDRVKSGHNATVKPKIAAATVPQNIGERCLLASSVEVADGSRKLISQLRQDIPIRMKMNAPYTVTISDVHTFDINDVERIVGLPGEHLTRVQIDLKKTSTSKLSARYFRMEFKSKIKPTSLGDVFPLPFGFSADKYCFGENEEIGNIFKRAFELDDTSTGSRSKGSEGAEAEAQSANPGMLLPKAYGGVDIAPQYGIFKSNQKTYSKRLATVFPADSITANAAHAIATTTSGTALPLVFQQNNFKTKEGYEARSSLTQTQAKRKLGKQVSRDPLKSEASQTCEIRLLNKTPDKYESRKRTRPFNDDDFEAVDMSAETDMILSTRSLRARSRSWKPSKVLFWYPSSAASDAVAIRQGDIDRLNDGVYLNDSLIDLFARKFLEERSKQTVKSKLHLFSSFFFIRMDHRLNSKRRTFGFDNYSQSAMELRYEAYSRVQTWTRGVDLFAEKRIIIVPINRASHWSVAFVILDSNDTESRPTATIFVLDSLGNYHPSDYIANVIRSYLNHEWVARTRAKEQNKPWPLPLRRTRDEENVVRQAECEREAAEESSDSDIEIVDGFSSEEGLDRFTVSKDAAVFTAESCPVKVLKVPRQDDSYNCGVYALRNIELLISVSDEIIQDALKLEEHFRALRFSSRNAYDFRKAMRVEISELGDSKPLDKIPEIAKVLSATEASAPSSKHDLVTSTKTLPNESEKGSTEGVTGSNIILKEGEKQRATVSSSLLVQTQSSIRAKASGSSLEEDVVEDTLVHLTDCGGADANAESEILQSKALPASGPRKGESRTDATKPDSNDWMANPNAGRSASESNEASSKRSRTFGETESCEESSRENDSGNKQLFLPEK